MRRRSGADPIADGGLLSLFPRARRVADRDFKNELAAKTQLREKFGFEIESVRGETQVPEKFRVERLHAGERIAHETVVEQETEPADEHAAVLADQVHRVIALVDVADAGAQVHALDGARSVDGVEAVRGDALNDRDQILFQILSIAREKGDHVAGGLLDAKAERVAAAAPAREAERPDAVDLARELERAVRRAAVDEDDLLADAERAKLTSVSA